MRGLGAQAPILRIPQETQERARRLGMDAEELHRMDELVKREATLLRDCRSRERARLEGRDAKEAHVAFDDDDDIPWGDLSPGGMCSCRCGCSTRLDVTRQLGDRCSMCAGGCPP